MVGFSAAQENQGRSGARSGNGSSVGEASLRGGVLEPGVPIGSDVFGEEIEQDLNLGSEARRAGEECAQGDRFRAPVRQNGKQAVAKVRAFRHPQRQYSDAEAADGEGESDGGIARDHSEGDVGSGNLTAVG